MSFLREQLEGITEKLSFITLENRELKRKNYQLKIKFSNMKREIERNKPNQDSIIEELYQEIMVLTLLVREVDPKVTGK